MMSQQDFVFYDTSLLTDDDIYLFNEGSQFRLYEKLGAHLTTRDTVQGTLFTVWAPDSEETFVMGDFNGWNKHSHPLCPKGVSGIWEGFIPGVFKGANYKYHIHSRFNGYEVDKSDPFALFGEVPPKTASRVWDLDYSWKDGEWMAKRGDHNAHDAPIAIYEVHLGSWMRVPEEENRSLNYRELAAKLAEYVERLGFTHVEFMPVMEHPFYGSWGYQTVGYFAPTARYGQPEDFMHLIDCLHQHGIGVILDWVPSHFPNDEYGLSFFDGTYLFEHADALKGVHPEWNTCVFNYGRREIQCFLISSALFWLDKYHADGLRVDAVASMLYLDYGRQKGEWIPNIYGGNENLEAIPFLRRLNEEVYKNFPDIQMIAEESTSWPMVSRPTDLGGLGFGMKWDMGWMHDTLKYMSEDPIHRKYHHNKLTFRMLYAFHENFMTPLSHDEVVYGKGSLWKKMPGDDWQKFANLRLLLGYMYAQPAKKLLFMGGEFAQLNEWYHERSLDWHLCGHLPHAGVQRWVTDLNRVYKEEPALYELDFDPSGFEWIDCEDSQNSTLSLLRKGRSNKDVFIIVLNFTPVPRNDYKVGVPMDGFWREILNSDAHEYGGSGQGNWGKTRASAPSLHGQPYSMCITLPPLSVLYFKQEQARDEVGNDNK
jgi:1,4-alpha-glucan branching enzyme